MSLIATIVVVMVAVIHVEEIVMEVAAVLAEVHAHILAKTHVKVVAKEDAVMVAQVPTHISLLFP
jgi:hypothetical protein